MGTWDKGIVGLEPFYEDVHAATSFYEDVFDLPAVDEDGTSATLQRQATAIPSAGSLPPPPGVRSSRLGRATPQTPQRIALPGELGKAIANP